MMSSLTMLSIHMLNMNAEHFKMIAKGISHSKVLTELGLHNIHRCGPEGAAHIAESLNSNATLRTLTMNGCRIGTRGINAFFAALEHNCSLKSLNLEYDYIDNENHPVVLEGLQKNSTLTWLSLYGSRIDYSLLINALKNHKSLKNWR